MNKENTHITPTESEMSGSFIKFPKKLINDPRYKGISYGAKLLYAMLCDRMSLSEMNNWYDDDGKVYIYYSVSAIAEDLGCCKETVSKLLRELKDNELIRSRKQGLGKPNIIYVQDINDNAEGRNIENKTAPNQKSSCQAVEKAELQKSEIPTSRSLKNRLQEVGKTDSNKTENNKTDINKTDINNTYSEIVCDVMEYLNEKAKKNYRLNDKNRNYIISRLKEGYTKEDFIHVIDVKHKEWYGTDKEKYIRPSTLFKDGNFDNYLNQREPVTTVKSKKTRLAEEHDYDVDMLERVLFGD